MEVNYMSRDNVAFAEMKKIVENTLKASKLKKNAQVKLNANVTSK